MTDVERRPSVARQEPFQAVKLELGVVMLVGLAAVFLALALDLPVWLEVLGLAAVGVAGAGWLVLRTRRLARSLQDSGEARHGPEQE